MKKLLLFVLTVSVTAMSYSQKKTFSYKLGIVTSTPIDTESPIEIGLGSTLGEVSYPLSKKIQAVGTLGYTRYKSGETKFSQVPASLGAVYAIDNMFHFGATIGVGFSKASTDVLYTPYIGLTVKKVSFDIHYFNTIKTEPIKLIGLVFSYKL